MLKISVVVPVFNPGPLIDECIRSLLDQSMAPGEYEAIFVDDGSTDATPARLDELARDHPHVRVRHIENSGWPGRPRNLGMDMARGEFVLFMDNDDWIGPEALERMYDVADRDDADVVVGKVVGHGKPVPPTLFAANRTGVSLDWPPLAWLLTPHRLFRKALLEEHGLRFPEGRRRLEDHVFVLGALFRTDRVSILADYPCYHWVLRDRQTNASAHEFDPAVYYANLREVLDVVDEHTEPGPTRDRLYSRWYRGKVLSRVGGMLFLNRAPDARRARFEDIRRLMEERFPPRLDEALPFLLGVRAALVRAGRMEPLERLAELETGLAPRIAVADVQLAPGEIELRLEATVQDPQALLRFAVGEDGTTWRPPAALARDVPAACLDAARVTEPGDAQLLLRRVEDPEEFLVPTEASVRLVPEAGGPQGARVALDLDARIATATVAAGRPLRPGRYVLRAVVGLAGARIDGPVTLGPHGVRLVLAIDEDGTPSLARASVRQRLAARAPGLRRLVVQAKRTLRS